MIPGSGFAGCKGIQATSAGRGAGHSLKSRLFPEFGAPRMMTVPAPRRGIPIAPALLGADRVASASSRAYPETRLQIRLQLFGSLVHGDQLQHPPEAVDPVLGRLRATILFFRLRVLWVRWAGMFDQNECSVRRSMNFRSRSTTSSPTHGANKHSENPPPSDGWARQRKRHRGPENHSTSKDRVPLKIQTEPRGTLPVHRSTGCHPRRHSDGKQETPRHRDASSSGPDQRKFGIRREIRAGSELTQLDFGPETISE